MENREGEPARLQLRREERVYLRRSSWFIETREGKSLGPYTSKQAATLDIARLLLLISDCSSEDHIAKVIERFEALEGYEDAPLDASGGRMSS